jgi:hypothetical protein
MRGAAPNPAGAWRKVLNGRSSGEILELQAQIDDLCQHPAFQDLRSLLIGAHDELVADLVGGPALDGSDYAKQTGTALGLRSLEDLMGDIRGGAERAAKKLAAQAESQRSQMEVV